MRLTLIIIVVSQFLCTSLWFAGNSIISDIVKELNLEPNFLAHMTSAIQFGFIIGTLVFAIFTISDRFSPSLVFVVLGLWMIIRPADENSFNPLFRNKIFVTIIGASCVLFFGLGFIIFLFKLLGFKKYKLIIKPPYWWFFLCLLF